jgi:transcription antitermination factor NusB
MKTPRDPRHLHRLHTVQHLFSYSFRDEKTLDENILPIIPHLADIDAHIETAAPQFPVSKIARVDVAILRLAIFELLIERKTPPKVIIDEAVELGKELGGDASPSFINGVLGTLYQKYYGEHV